MNAFGIWGIVNHCREVNCTSRCAKRICRSLHLHVVSLQCLMRLYWSFNYFSNKKNNVFSFLLFSHQTDNWSIICWDRCICPPVPLLYKLSNKSAKIHYMHVIIGQTSAKNSICELQLPNGGLCNLKKINRFRVNEIKVSWKKLIKNINCYVFKTYIRLHMESKARTICISSYENFSLIHSFKKYNTIYNTKLIYKIFLKERPCTKLFFSFCYD